jgi:hypothetical protein
MMNPYKGIIRLECNEEKCGVVKGKNVEPQCIYCKAGIFIVDHDGNTLAHSTCLEAIKDESPAPQQEAKPKVKKDAGIKLEEVTEDGI